MRPRQQAAQAYAIERSIIAAEAALDTIITLWLQANMKRDGDLLTAHNAVQDAIKALGDAHRPLRRYYHRALSAEVEVIDS